MEEGAPPAATEQRRRGAAAAAGGRSSSTVPLTSIDARDARLNSGFETDNDIDDDGNPPPPSAGGPALARARPQATA